MMCIYICIYFNPLEQQKPSTHALMLRPNGVFMDITTRSTRDVMWLHSYILWLYFCAPRVLPLPSSPLCARKTWPFIWLGNVNEYQCAVKKPSTTFSICECDILTLIAQHTRARAAELRCCYWRRRRWTAAAGAATADTAHKNIFLYVLVLGGGARCRTSAKHGLMLPESSIEGTFCVCVHCA